MKNPTLTAAFVLVGLALLVGGFAFLSGSGEAEPITASLPAVAADESPKVRIEAVSPREKRKAVNLETAKRELERIKREGEEVAPGTYLIVDANGQETLYGGELIPGIGRNGEPLWMMSQAIKAPTMPAMKHKPVPKGKAPKLAKNKLIKGISTGRKDGKSPPPSVVDVGGGGGGAPGSDGSDGSGGGGDSSKAGKGKGGMQPETPSDG